MGGWGIDCYHEYWGPWDGTPRLENISFWFLLYAFFWGKGFTYLKKNGRWESLATTVGGLKVVKNENKK